MPRSEQFPNGTTKERSTREWCLSLTEEDSTTSIKCDVVNGGYDQKAYMLVPPRHYKRVLSEFSNYKSRVFPFRQREERFRSSIGRPPAVIEISTRQKINDSLAIFDSLVSPTESGRNDATIATKPASKDADRRGSSVSSRFSSNTSISESTVDSYQGQQSIASLPLRQHRNQDDQTVTTASSNSGKATSISSTQARFHELDAIWKRQRKDHDKLSKITDDRLSQMERQFHRLDTSIDKSLQDSNASHEEHKLRFRGLESQVVQFMERQVTMGDNVLSIEDKINSLISVVTSLAKPKDNSSSGAATTDNSQNAVYQQSQYGTDSILQLVDTGDFDSNKSSSDSSDESMSYRSTTSFPSPEKKKSLEDYHYYLQSIKSFHIDVAGLVETNTCWQHNHLQSDFKKKLWKHHQQSRVVFGYPSQAIDPCSVESTYQPGGSLTAVTGTITSSIFGDSIQDPTGLGRWCGFTIRGSSDFKLTVITAYRVCSGNVRTSPLGSSFSREYHYFKDQGYKSPNPRKLFFQHLAEVIRQLQDDGNAILLMMDANSQPHNESFFENFLVSCNLVDLHQDNPPNSTYIGSPSRRIDFIYGSESLAQKCVRAGALAYNEGPQSDHRGLFVDLEIGELQKNLIQQPLAPSTHRPLTQTTRS
ncbi:hypothetical protein MHU86_434 [Fragilaria crotonensis]|nr:hypothetical protein MHU86_434 [Fragilaria crotonensis]